MRSISRFTSSLRPLSFSAAGDPEGRAWIAALPALAEKLCRRWGLEPEHGTPRSGYHGVVIPVRRGDERCMLKLTWPAERIVDEARSLEAWGGHGAVLALEADTGLGALLMERLNPRRTLHDLPLSDAAAIAGNLLRELAIPAPEGIRETRDLAGEIARSLPIRQAHLGNPAPEQWLATARDLAHQLACGAGRSMLVHADLHYGNVLAGERAPWLAIDPRPVAGDPEHAVPELLWTRVDEAENEEAIRQLLTVLIRGGGLDAEKARGWAVVRCMDYWLWGLEHGLTEDPKRCRRILAALV